MDKQGLKKVNIQNTDSEMTLKLEMKKKQK